LPPMWGKVAEWFGLNKVLGGLILVGAVGGIILAIYLLGKSAGTSSCEAAHNKAQLGSDTNRKAGDARIDKTVPITAGRTAKLNWLRSRTVGN
jgi:hypothetical protein